MRYSSNINNVKSLEWGLDIKLAYLFSWMYELPSWADKIIFGNTIFYFASKNKAVEELPLLTDKTDTMYRYYKQLESMGLIEIKRFDNKDYISITSKGKQWNLSEHSDKNPTSLGNLSENNSDKNPTYNIYNINNNTNIKKDETLFPVDESINPDKFETINWKALINQFNTITGKESKVICEKTRRAILKRFSEGYTKEDLLTAIFNCFNDPHHKETNHKYLTLEFISRPDKMEKFSTVKALPDGKTTNRNR